MRTSATVSRGFTKEDEAPKPIRLGGKTQNGEPVEERGGDPVVVYRGNTDLYHLIFPREGGVLVEPLAGEFTRIVKGAR